MPENFVSVIAYNEPPEIGSAIAFSVLSTGEATARGSDFVADVIERFFPHRSDKDSPLEIVTGASNSWAVIFCSPSKKSLLLAGGGVQLEQIAEICGLRRMTIVSRRTDIRAQIKEFINDSWRDVAVEFVSDMHVSCVIPSQEAIIEKVDPRKLRTFNSMWRKLFPNVKVDFYVEAVASGERISIDVDHVFQRALRHVDLRNYD